MFHSVVQIFKPGGLTTAAGTPNLLLDLSANVYQAQWTDLQQGGISQAVFELRQPYEDSADLVFGNWVLFGALGGNIYSTVAAGATSLPVANLQSGLAPTADILDIQAGDGIIITDGINTEMFVASAVNGSGGTPSISLAAPPGIAQATTLNAYGTNAIVVRLIFQGMLRNRLHSTNKNNQFALTAEGFFNHYGAVIGSSTYEDSDGAALMLAIAQSYSSTLSEIIVNSANFAASSVPVTIKARDQRISQIMTSIMRQEDVKSPSTIYAVWVDAFRQMHHEQIVTGPSICPTTPVLSTVAGGSLFAATYFVRTTYVTSTGETPPSSEASIATPADYLPVVTSPSASPTVTGWNVYLSNASGTEVLQNTTPIAIGTNWTMPTSGPVAGTAAPIATYAIDLNNDPGSPFGDSISQVDTTDMDGQSLVNAVICTGGKDVNGKTLRILVEQTDSISTFNGWYEGKLSNTNITDPQQLANWAAAQLAVIAYPKLKSKVSFAAASCRMTSRNLVSITGFTDGSTLLANPVSTSYTIIAKNQTITGSADLGVMGSTATIVMREIADEHAIKQGYTYANPNLAPSALISGCQFTATGGANFTISAGVILYQGQIYAIPAMSGTAPLYGSEWGAQATPTPEIIQLPYNVWNGTNRYGEYLYQVTERGGAPTQTAAFAGIPLYIVHVYNGVLSYQSVYPEGGVGNSNLKPPTGGSPSLSGVSVAVAAEGSASAYATVGATVGGMTFDDTIASIDLTYSIAGANAWHPSVPIAYSPSTGAVTGVQHGLAAGQAYDLALLPRGRNGAPLGSPVVIGTSPTVAASAITAAISARGLPSMPVGATISATSITEYIYDGGGVTRL